MKHYVDCVSAVQPLHDISEKKHKEMNVDHKIYIDSEFYHVKCLFAQCYYNGAVSSVISRRVIDSSVLLKNIADTMDNLTTTLSEYEVTQIYLAAISGVSKSCALYDQQYYQPRKNDAVNV